MFEALGKRVIYLKRISMGPLKLPDDLKTCLLYTSDVYKRQDTRMIFLRKSQRLMPYLAPIHMIL